MAEIAPELKGPATIPSYPITIPSAQMATGLAQAPEISAERQAKIAEAKARTQEAPIDVEAKQQALDTAKAAQTQAQTKADTDLLGRLAPLASHPNAESIFNAPNMRKIIDPVLGRMGLDTSGPIDASTISSLLNPKKRFQDLTDADIAGGLSIAPGPGREAYFSRFDVPPDKLQQLLSAPQQTTSTERIDTRKRIEGEWKDVVGAKSTPDQLLQWVQFHKSEMKNIAGMSDEEIAQLTSNPAVLQQTGQLLQAQIDRLRGLGLLDKTKIKGIESQIRAADSLEKLRKIQGDFLGFKEQIMTKELQVKISKANTASTNAQTRLGELAIKADESQIHLGSFRAQFIRDNAKYVRDTEEDARKDLKDLSGQYTLATLRKEKPSEELLNAIKNRQDTITKAEDTLKKMTRPVTATKSADDLMNITHRTTTPAEPEPKKKPDATNPVGVHAAVPTVPFKGTLGKAVIDQVMKDHPGTTQADAISQANRQGFTVDLNK